MWLRASKKPEFNDLGEKLIEVIKFGSIYDRVHKNNKSDLSKLTWKNKTKMYVEPKQIDLEDGDKYHYVLYSISSSIR